MDKTSKGDTSVEASSTPGVERQAKGTTPQDRDSAVWIREDGAVCFGNECAVIKPGENDTLDLEVRPDRCGKEIGGMLLDYLIRSTGRGVNIKIPPRESLGE